MQPVKICFMVEDDLDDQEIFAIALQESNQKIQCVFANDGIEALRKLEDGSFLPDYIFLDLNMPRMNGTQCLTEIRKIRRLHHIPVIIYSTSSNKASIREAERLGATDYFIKPSSISELTQKLVQLLKS